MPKDLLVGISQRVSKNSVRVRGCSNLLLVALADRREFIPQDPTVIIVGFREKRLT